MEKSGWHLTKMRWGDATRVIKLASVRATAITRLLGRPLPKLSGAHRAAPVAIAAPPLRRPQCHALVVSAGEAAGWKTCHAALETISLARAPKGHQSGFVGSFGCGAISVTSKVTPRSPNCSCCFLLVMRFGMRKRDGFFFRGFSQARLWNFKFPR